MADFRDYLLHGSNIRSQRLPSLYSDFHSQKTINPDGYQENVTAWLSILADIVGKGLVPSSNGQADTLVLQAGEELLRSLELSEYGRPLALGTVIEEGVRRRQMMELQQFLPSNASAFPGNWIPTPWQVVKWSLKQLGLVAQGELVEGQFVLVRNTERVASRVLEHASASHKSRIDCILSRDLFVKEAQEAVGSDGTLSSLDCEVLLAFLCRDKNAIAYDGHTVKFKKANEACVSITEEDSSVASLKSLISKLTGQIDALTARVESLSTSAREYVAKGNRASALAALKSKKITNSNLQARWATLAQLEEAYLHIEQAADQIEVVRAMEASAKVLKSMHREIGGVDRVADVYDSLKEELATVNEMGQLMSEPMTAEAAVDEEELDEEMAAMESQVRAEADMQKHQADLETLSKLVVAGGHAQPTTTTTAETVVDKDAIDETIDSLSRLSVDANTKDTHDTDEDDITKKLLSN